MIFYFSGNPWQSSERLKLEYRFAFTHSEEHARLEPFGEPIGNILNAATEMVEECPDLSKVRVTWPELCEQE